MGQIVNITRAAIAIFFAISLSHLLKCVINYCVVAYNVYKVKCFASKDASIFQFYDP